MIGGAAWPHVLNEHAGGTGSQQDAEPHAVVIQLRLLRGRIVLREPTRRLSGLLARLPLRLLPRLFFALLISLRAWLFALLVGLWPRLLLGLLSLGSRAWLRRLFLLRHRSHGPNTGQYQHSTKHGDRTFHGELS